MPNDYPKIQVTWSRKDSYSGGITNITARGETVSEVMENVGLALQGARKAGMTQDTTPANQAPSSPNGAQIGVAGGVIGKCPKCGSQLAKRFSKVNNQYFLGCSNYPNCKYTRPE